MKELQTSAYLYVEHLIRSKESKTARHQNPEASQSKAKWTSRLLRVARDMLKKNQRIHVIKEETTWEQTKEANKAKPADITIRY